MQPVPRRHISVFISSSFAHREARDRIKEILEDANSRSVSANAPTTFITGHLHERDGYSNLIPDVSSQELINAYAVKCEAFILYAGNKIGEFTVNEFENAILHTKRHYQFIFVVHNPEDIVDEQSGTRYISWEDFDKFHLQRPDGVRYYHKETTSRDLTDTIISIRNEIVYQKLVALSPSDMDYSRMLTVLQDRYRKSTFYLHRQIDRLVTDFLTEPSSLLGVVTGMSLAGKTRVVIENLKLLSPEKLRIYYLNRDSETGKVIEGLNFNTQFPSGVRSILFIDEIDEVFGRYSVIAATESKENLQKRLQTLILSGQYQEAAEIAKKLEEQTDDEDLSSYTISTKFIELCQFAADNPGRLTIIGTTVMPFSEFINAIRSRATSATWLDRCEELPIKPMTKDEIYVEVRKLRSLNQLPEFDTKKIRDGMPIGALFVNLTRLSNIYEDLNKYRFAPRIFDAIKTLWLWKNHNKNNPEVLLDFINKAYDTSRTITEAELYTTLQKLSALINIRGNIDYTFETEEILVDEVFRFEDERTDRLRGFENASRNAINRIIRYILQTNPERKFFTFSKLTSRLNKKRPELYRYAVEEIGSLFPLESLTVVKEDIEMYGGNIQNGVHLWIASVVTKVGLEGNFEETRRIYALFPDDAVLAAVLSFEQNRKYFRNILFPSGELHEKFYCPTSRSLPRVLLEMCDFEQSLNLLINLDFEKIAEYSISKTAFSDELRDEIVRNLAKMCFTSVLSHASSFNDMLTALFYFDARNDAREKNGLKKWYVGRAEQLFSFTSHTVWIGLSERVTSYDIPRIFDFLLDIPLPDGKNHEVLRLNKIYCLNNLLRPMKDTEAIQRWLRMGDLRDTFTLMTIISKCPDFAQAYGFVEAFIEEVGKGKIRLSTIFANKLLDTVSCVAELEECTQLYKSLELLSDKDMDEAREAGIQPLCVLHDEVVHLSIISKRFIPLDECHKILKYLIKNNYSRTDILYAQLVYRSPDFFSAYNILYGKCDFITASEQAILREMPVAVSHLIRKAKTEEEVSIAKEIVDALIDEATNNPDEAIGILHHDHNIVAEYLKNNFLTADYAECKAFLTKIEKNTGVALSSGVIDRPVLHKLWIENPYETKAVKIQITNDTIISRTGCSAKDIISLVNIRFQEGRTRMNSQKRFPKLDTVEPFPYIESDKSWTIKNISRLEFLKNMIKNRFAHIAMVQMAVMSLAEEAKRKKESFIRNKMICSELLNLASEQSMFFEFEGAVRLRSALGIFNDTNIQKCLMQMTSGYSITKDLCYHLHEGNITVDEALNRIKGFETRYGIRLYRTTAFYDAVIHRLTLDESSTIDSIMKLRCKLFPKNQPWTPEQKFFVLHKIRTVRDFETLRIELDKWPKDWTRAVRSAVGDAARNSSLLLNKFRQKYGADRAMWPGNIELELTEKNKNRDSLIHYLLGIEYKDDRIIINPCLEPDTPTSNIVGLYSYAEKMTYDKLLALINDNNLRLDEPAFKYLALKIKNLNQLHRMEAIEGFRWNAEVVGSLLSNLSRGRFFKCSEEEALLDYIHEYLLPVFRAIYHSQPMDSADNNFWTSCRKIYNDNKFISPADKGKTHLLKLANICWEIIKT